MMYFAWSYNNNRNRSFLLVVVATSTALLSSSLLLDIATSVQAWQSLQSKSRTTSFVGSSRYKIPVVPFQRKQQYLYSTTTARCMYSTSNNNNDNDYTANSLPATTTIDEEQQQQSMEYHDIVLFSIGDLRVDDHGGITNAIQLQLKQQQQQQRSNNNNNNGIVHCCIILNDVILQNICGIVAHTVDTINCIITSIQELQSMLMYYNQTLTTSSSSSSSSNTNNVSIGPLHCIISNDSSSSTTDDSIIKYINDYVDSLNLSSSRTSTNNNLKIRLHVCDLGPIDNELGYTTYGQILLLQNNTIFNSNSNSQYEIVPWKNVLRTKPWEDVGITVSTTTTSNNNLDDDTFPMYYPQYEFKYNTNNQPPLPVVNSCYDQNYNTIDLSLSKDTGLQWSIPSVETLLQRIQKLLPQDHNMNDTINTGLYGTHYGGVSSSSSSSVGTKNNIGGVGCQSVLQTLYHYCHTCQEDDAMFMNQRPEQQLQKTNPSYVIQYNPRSLEHTSMMWQLGYTNDDEKNNQMKDTSNWLDGEVMIRYLLLPLYLGTISPRRIWHVGGRDSRNSLFISSLWNPPPLRTLVEGREWHNLLAARNYYSDKVLQQQQQQSKTKYKYWRYHGILCRYAETDLLSSSDMNDDEEKRGILLVHGFGASGTQWNKAMYEFSSLSLSSASPFHTGLAPDLIGFGQSEKPALSYTGYMWDSQIMDFVKEIAIPKNQWTSFITGGNSIGGYTSMSFAACDTALEQHVTSSGSSGTKRCSGLVLMNSAGPIKTEDEIMQELMNSDGTMAKPISVAAKTSTFNLPTCTPPPRPIARLIGNVLLAYLRPNIQSICRNIYPTNPNAVDDALVYEIERDSLDPGAINVMMAGAKLPPPRTSNELLGAKYGSSVTIPNDDNYIYTESYFDGPVLIAQGILDPLNNATDRMNRFYALRDGIDIAPINAGHCPHDELPYDVAYSIAQWSMNSIYNTTTSVVTTTTLLEATTM